MQNFQRKLQQTRVEVNITVQSGERFKIFSLNSYTSENFSCLFIWNNNVLLTGLFNGWCTNSAVGKYS